MSNCVSCGFFSFPAAQHGSFPGAQHGSFPRAQHGSFPGAQCDAGCTQRWQYMVAAASRRVGHENTFAGHQLSPSAESCVGLIIIIVVVVVIVVVIGRYDDYTSPFSRMSRAVLGWSSRKYTFFLSHPPITVPGGRSDHISMATTSAWGYSSSHPPSAPLLQVFLCALLGELYG